MVSSKSQDIENLSYHFIPMCMLQSIIEKIHVTDSYIKYTYSNILLILLYIWLPYPSLIHTKMITFFIRCLCILIDVLNTEEGNKNGI